MGFIACQTVRNTGGFRAIVSIACGRCLFRWLSTWLSTPPGLTRTYRSSTLIPARQIRSFPSRPIFWRLPPSRSQITDLWPARFLIPQRHRPNARLLEIFRGWYGWFCTKYRPIPRLARPGSRKSPAQRPPAHRIFGHNHESKNFSARKGRATRATPLSPPQIPKEIRLSGPRTRNRAARCR